MCTFRVKSNEKVRVTIRVKEKIHVQRQRKDWDQGSGKLSISGLVHVRVSMKSIDSISTKGEIFCKNVVINSGSN